LQVTNEYNDLEKEEVNIISGTLELKEKMVKDVMTKVDDAFMLSEDAILDFETLNEIREKGKTICFVKLAIVFNEFFVIQAILASQCTKKATATRW